MTAFTAFLVFFSWLWTTQGLPDPPTPQKIPGHIVALTDRAWVWLADEPGSSNAVILSGSSSTLVVDPGLSPARTRAVMAAAEEVTGRRPDIVVLTHGHPDHALGTVCSVDMDLRVLSHPKTRRFLAEGAAQFAQGLSPQQVGSGDRAALRNCRPRLPEPTPPAGMVLDLGEHRIVLLHTGPAHTQGDLAVWSEAEGVLATGDLFIEGSTPFIGGGSVSGWSETVVDLLALHADFVVPGHFDVSETSDLARFGRYLSELTAAVDKELVRGTSIEVIPDRIRLDEFSDLERYPEFGADLAGNARAVALERASRPAPRGHLEGFTVKTVIDVGLNPHQITFTANGQTAYVAAAGSDQITHVDVTSRSVSGQTAVPGVPLGVALVNNDREILVSRFGGQAVVRYDLASGEVIDSLSVGVGASLFVPLPEDRWMFSVERTNRLWVVDGGDLEKNQEYEVGARPFPPAATSDGRLAFVPGYDDGTVTVIDLWNQTTVGSITVGTNPSGGAVLPGNIDYAVVIRGEDRLGRINGAGRALAGMIEDGIGDSPFSVVVTPNDRLGFVNNTASHDISVFDFRFNRVVARIPVHQLPIVMAVHPSGEELWVSSEGEDGLTVIEIPAEYRGRPDEHEGLLQNPADPGAPSWVANPEWRRPASENIPPGRTEVAVMGMIHSEHRTSDAWGLEEVIETVRRLKPDVLCVEVPPDRWERIWSDFTERGVFEDPRVRVFPEYVDALFDLSVEMGYAIVPCAGWTTEMNNLRRTQIGTFDTSDQWATQRVAYARDREEARAQSQGAYGESDDPFFIHSEAYDEGARAELDVYDRYQNNLIGPGGWTNINAAHWRLVERAIELHRGQRVLVTFGGGHKYWLLDRLRERPDVDLLEITPFLPQSRDSR